MPRQKPTPSDALANLDDVALMRLSSVLRVYPVSKSTWWEGVADGRYPSPVKLSKRVSAWRVTDIRRLLASIAETGESVTASRERR